MHVCVLDGIVGRAPGISRRAYRLSHVAAWTIAVEGGMVCRCSSGMCGVSRIGRRRRDRSLSMHAQRKDRRQPCRQQKYRFHGVSVRERSRARGQAHVLSVRTDRHNSLQPAGAGQSGENGSGRTLEAVGNVADERRCRRNGDRRRIDGRQRPIGGRRQGGQADMAGGTGTAFGGAKLDGSRRGIIDVRCR